MLTDEEKYNNKIRYIELLSRLNVDLTNFIVYLSDINYFEKPATTQYQFSYAGGLCEQALKECHELGVLCSAYFPDRYTEEDIIKVALLRNLYRAEMYEAYNKNVKNETTGQWESVGAFRITENRNIYGDSNFSSYMIAKRYFLFTDEQIEAILNSNPMNNYSLDIYGIQKTYPLVVLTKMADLVVNNFNV